MLRRPEVTEFRRRSPWFKALVVIAVMGVVLILVLLSGCVAATGNLR